MSRFLFFLLLLAALAFGAHLWLAAQSDRPDLASRERDADRVRILSVVPPVMGEQAPQPGSADQSLAGAPCVEFTGLAPADFARAHDAFATLRLGERLSERRVEDVSRYWVFIRPVPDRRTAEASIAQLKRLGVGDVSIRPDNAISLGVFSSEDAARRFLASLTAKGVKGAEEAPFTRELRELSMLVRDPDTETVARLAILQRDFPGTHLRAVACPAPEPKGAG